MAGRRKRDQGAPDFSGDEDVPSELRANLDDLRKGIRLLRLLGIVVSGCPWCFFRTLAVRAATCKVCGTRVRSSGGRRAPDLVFEGSVVLPGAVGRERAERMITAAMESYLKIELQQLWKRASDPKKEVN